MIISTHSAIISATVHRKADSHGALRFSAGGCPRAFSTYTLSRRSIYTVSVRSTIFTSTSLALSRVLERSLSVTVVTRSVSPCSFSLTVMVVTSIRVSRASIRSTLTLSLNSTHSTLSCSLCELVACRLTPQAVHNRAVSPVRTTVNLLNGIPQLCDFLA